MKKTISVFFLLIAVLLLTSSCGSADNFDQVMARWKKERYLTNEIGANLRIEAVYYSAEFIEASIQHEAEKNLWTQQETDNYKYNYLKALQLNEMIPINIKFINNGPSMHLGPFDLMVKLRIKNKTYKPVDYDKRFNFKFQGEREGLVYFPRYDEKTGKNLLDGVNSVRLEFSNVITLEYEKGNINFLWDVANDDPRKIYAGKAAARFETERLLQRLEKLRADKAELEAKMQSIADEMAMIQKRLDELEKQ